MTTTCRCALFSVLIVLAGCSDGGQSGDLSVGHLGGKSSEPNAKATSDAGVDAPAESSSASTAVNSEQTSSSAPDKTSAASAFGEEQCVSDDCVLGTIQAMCAKVATLDCGDGLDACLEENVGFWADVRNASVECQRGFAATMACQAVAQWQCTLYPAPTLQIGDAGAFGEMPRYYPDLAEGECTATGKLARRICRDEAEKKEQSDSSELQADTGDSDIAPAAAPGAPTSTAS